MPKPATSPPPDRTINSATAAAIAKQRGTPINMNSLLVAVRRGNVQGAVKVNGRWKFPFWACHSPGDNVPIGVTVRN